MELILGRGGTAAGFLAAAAVPVPVVALVAEPRAAREGGGEDRDGEESEKDQAARRLASMIRRVAKLSLGRTAPAAVVDGDPLVPSPAGVGLYRRDKDPSPLPPTPFPGSEDAAPAPVANDRKPKPTLPSYFLEADRGGGLNSDRLNSIPLEATTDDDRALTDIELGVRRLFAAAGGDGSGGGVEAIFRADRRRTRGAEGLLDSHPVVARSSGGGVMGAKPSPADTAMCFGRHRCRGRGFGCGKERAVQWAYMYDRSDIFGKSG